MKKNYFLSLCLLLFASMAFAQQPKATEGSGNIGKGEGTYISITCLGKPNNVEDLLKEKIKKMKGKKGSEKGWEVIEQAVWPEITDKTLDYYYRVEKAGNDESKIMFALSFGNANFISAKEDGGAINGVKQMLENLVEEIRVYEIQLAIDAQTKVVEGAVKDEEKLVGEGEKLTKDQAKLEKELEQNKKDQEANKKSQEEQKKVVEQEKKLLGELQKKLGN
ncbi:MAG: hypothetical protein H6581_22365 [Bacteroidia bacterium]|nr:hypothetical protein [Bacteroidia bacterium]